VSRAQGPVRGHNRQQHVNRFRKNTVIDRGSNEDQDRWITELEAAEAAENFPPGGSVILAESPAHALEIVYEMKARGHRAIAHGVYVRTTYEMRKK
jgi:hypothetical protein